MGWLLNGPYLIYSLIFFLIPLIWAFWLSTMDWNLMSEQKTFVGIRNFAGLFSDSRVKAAFINSYRYLLPIVVLCFAGGLIIALLVSNLGSGGGFILYSLSDLRGCDECCCKVLF